MLHLETIEPTTLQLLKGIQALPEFATARLVGGTSLALQIGHRKSIDLDLFGNDLIDANDMHEALMSVSSNVQLVSSSRTMRFFVVDGVKVDFVCYPYQWINPAVEEDGVRLASVDDMQR